MSAKIFRLDPEVLQVLERCDTNGSMLELPEQLERKLYIRVAKALESIGCKWNKREKVHNFPDGTDAEAALDALVVAGQVHLPDSFDFFRTPLEVVEQLVELADIERHHVCGEFSAGDGAIASYLQPLVDAQVITCDIRGDMCEKLRALGFDPKHADFLTLPPQPLCDRIVINPPFSKHQEVKHVLHALQFLKPGGRLTAVMSSAIAWRESRLYQVLRDFIAVRGGEVIKQPSGSFRISGTQVETCLVAIDAVNDHTQPVPRIVTSNGSRPKLKIVKAAPAAEFVLTAREY